MMQLTMMTHIKVGHKSIMMSHTLKDVPMPNNESSLWLYQHTNMRMHFLNIWSAEDEDKEEKEELETYKTKKAPPTGGA